MKKLLIIGNGPVFNHYEPLLNDAKVIVRFNSAKRIGDYDHGRQTILAICNTGAPGKYFLNQNYLEKSDDFNQCESLLIPRVERCHIEHFNTIKKSFPKYHKKELKSYSDEILPYLKASAKNVILISEELNKKCFEKIKAISKKPFICPSTGFITLNYILENSNFADYEIHLLGFGFRGWKGHPWAAERQIIRKLSLEKRIILHTEPNWTRWIQLIYQKIKKNKLATDSSSKGKRL